MAKNIALAPATVRASDLEGLPVRHTAPVALRGGVFVELPIEPHAPWPHARPPGPPIIHLLGWLARALVGRFEPRCRCCVLSGVTSTTMASFECTHQGHIMAGSAGDFPAGCQPGSGVARYNYGVRWA